MTDREPARIDVGESGYLSHRVVITYSRRACGQLEVDSMKSMQRVFGLAAVAAAMMGCGAETTQTSEASISKQAVTVVECGTQLAQCTLAARGFRALGACSTAFTDCNAQAAEDLLDVEDLLADCRAESQDCLQGAVSLSDIRSCRSVFDACSGDVLDAADAVVGDAVDTAQDAIDEAAAAAIDIINSASGAAGDALALVNTCRESSTDCLTAADSVSDVLACEEVFEECALDAVDLASELVEELPGPTPAEILAAVDACTAKSDDCLSGAVTVTDISACRAVLTDCVDAAAGIVESTVGELPTPVEVIDCNVGLTQCLLTSLNPVACINEANECLDLL